MRPIRAISAFLFLLTVASAAPLPASIEVAGRVFGLEGTPLAGARVEVFRGESYLEEVTRVSRGKYEAEAVVEGKSDRAGRFALELPEVGAWRVRVSASGYVPMEGDDQLILRSGVLADVHLSRARQMNLHVIDEEGTGIPGAIVSMAPYLAGGGWRLARQTVVSDAEGVVRLTATRGARLAVSIVASGFAPLRAKDIASTSRRLRLVRGRPRKLLVTGESGKPLPGAIATLGGSSIALGTAGEEGELELMLAPGAGIDVGVVDPETGAVGRVKAEASPDPAAPPLQAVLPPVGTVSGKVLSAEGRHPSEGALVWIASGKERAVRSDESGLYELRGGSRGTATLYADGEGCLRKHLSATGEGGRILASFALRPAAAVEGTVVDGEGRPVAGALVVAAEVDDQGGMSRPALFLGEPRREGSDLLLPASTLSGEGGHFRIEGLDPDQEYKVGAEAPAFAPSFTPVTGLAPHRVVQGVRVVLEPGSRILGRIVDEEEDPLAGAEVEVREAGRPLWLAESPPVRVATSDAEGRFALERMPAGSFDIDVRRAGYVHTTLPGVQVTAGRDLDLPEISMEPGVPLFGRVVDDEGAPVAGAAVYLLEGPAAVLMSMGSISPMQKPQTRSGADGGFVVADRRRGETVGIGAKAEGFTVGGQRGVKVGEGKGVEIRLTPASRVSGVVLDEEDQPIADAFLMLVKTLVGPGGMVLPGGIGGSGESDGEGRFVIESVPPGAWSIKAVAGGFLDATKGKLEVARGQDLEGLTLHLEKGATLRGTVVGPEGSPVAGVQVALVQQRRSGGGMDWLSAPGKRGKSDGEGRFLLQSLEPGKRSVKATRAGYPPVTRDLTLKEGSNSILLTLPAGSSVKGRVADRQGAPIAGARVRLTRVGGGSGSGESGPEGSFLIEGLAPGEYQAYASASGFLPTSERPRVSVGERGEMPSVELVLERGAVIRGHVLGVDPKEYSKTTVVARGGAEGGWASSSVDYEGAFLLEGLRSARWSLEGQVEGTGRRASAEITIEPEASEASIDLEFGRGYTLSGRVLRRGTPVAGVRVWAVRESGGSAHATTDGEGRFSLEGLDEGRYRVAAREGGLGLAVEKQVVITDDLTLDLEFPTGSVSGRVLRGADRKPLSGAIISAVRSDPEGPGSAPSWFSSGGATTDGQGRFEIEGLAQGSWRIKATLPGYGTKDVEMSLGEGEHSDGVEIQLDSEEGMILRVLDPAGVPVQSASVLVLDPMGNSVTGQRIEAGESGTLFVESVPAGQWKVLVRVPGAAVGRATVTVPGAVAAIQLERSCTLVATVDELADESAGATLSLFDSEGRLFRRPSLWAGQAISRFELIGGSVRVTGLPPGQWTLRVQSRDGREWKGQVQTSPGKPARVSL